MVKQGVPHVIYCFYMTFYNCYTIMLAKPFYYVKKNYGHPKLFLGWS